MMNILKELLCSWPSEYSTTPRICLGPGSRTNTYLSFYRRHMIDPSFDGPQLMEQIGILTSKLCWMCYGVQQTNFAHRISFIGFYLVKVRTVMESV